MKFSSRTRRVAGSVTLVLGLSALSVGASVATAGAVGAGKLTIYPGMSSPFGVAAGPDGALWFTN